MALCASLGTTLRCFSGEVMMSVASKVVKRAGEGVGVEEVVDDEDEDGVEIQFHSRKRRDTAITPCTSKRRMAGILGNGKLRESDRSSALTSSRLGIYFRVTVGADPSPVLLSNLAPVF